MWAAAKGIIYHLLCCFVDYPGMSYLTNQNNVLLTVVYETEGHK